MSLRYLGVLPKAAKEVPLAKLTSDPDPAELTLAAMRPAEPAIRDIAASAVVPSGSVRIPDMRGWSTREAAKAALGLGLLPAVDGTGMLQRQAPPAGAVLPKGSTVKLFFVPPT